MFAMLARLVVDRPRLFVVVALGLVLAGGLSFARFESQLIGVDYRVDGTESARAAAVVERATGFSESAVLVVTVKGGAGRAGLEQAVERARGLVRDVDPDVGIFDPLPVGDGRTTRAVPLGLVGDAGRRQAFATEVQDALERMPDGYRAGLTGNSALLADLTHVEEADLLRAEAIGLPITLLLLILAFGSVVAALLPLAQAYGGILGAVGIVALVMTVQEFNTFAESLMLMFGLALGVDYSLLFVRRFREERAAGGSGREVVERTLATAGRTVLASGAIFSIALLPLLPTRLPFFYDTVIAVIVVVLVELLLVVTLLPVLLVALGDRVELGRLPRLRPAAGGRRTADVHRWDRWARLVMRRPLPFLVVGVAVLVVAAAPALGMRTGVDLNVRALDGSPSVRALDDLQAADPAAALAPVEVVVRDATAGDVAQVQSVLEVHGVGAVTTTALSETESLVSGTSAAPVDSAEGFDEIGVLRSALRADAPSVDALVGGATAEGVDYSERTEAVQGWVVGAVLLLSLVLLTAVFRSPLLALKAVVLNLLAIGAAIGLTVAFFQSGALEGLLGFESAGFLQSWTPLTLFVMLFGLSMDYEVFMISRIREEYERCGDTIEAVAVGLQRTASVVTYAGAIMVAVFGSFMISSVPEMKQLGFGLAVAVLIDVAIVRLVLVPALMRVAGRWNWWMPSGFARVLPDLAH